MESISELPAPMKVGTMAASERDAGFCSGGDEDDMYDLHSPSASEDSLEVQVTPISSKNKRKLVEPRKIREPNSAPLKKRRFGGIEERTVPDAESSRMLESPSPFRPWSSADKRIDFKMSSISTETTTVSQPCVLALSPNASQRIDSPYRHHRHHRHSHRHHHRTSANKNDDDNEDVHDNVRRGSTDRGQGNTVDDTYIRAFDSDDDEEYESTTGDGFEKQDETQRRETLEARFRQSAPARSTRCEKREFFRQKTSVAIVPNANSTTMSDNAVSLDSVLSRTTHPRLQEEPLSLVLRADASARVPSHPAVNGTYEKTCAYTMERSNVSPAASSSPLSSSLSSLSSSSSSSASCSSASSSSSSSSSHRQQNHRSCSSGGDACSTAGTTTATITTTTTTTPTSTATNVPNNHTRQHASAGQQRNYKNMTRERRIEANARERTRVHTISAAFETLRRAIPAYSHNQKLSKLSVLRIACSYIMTLGKIVDTPQTDPTNGASLGACVDLVSRTIQTEGKLRKRKED